MIYCQLYSIQVRYSVIIDSPLIISQSRRRSNKEGKTIKILDLNQLGILLNNIFIYSYQIDLKLESTQYLTCQNHNLYPTLHNQWIKDFSITTSRMISTKSSSRWSLGCEPTMTKWSGSFSSSKLFNSHVFQRELIKNHHEKYI